MFQISGLNAFRWVNRNPVLDPRYNTLPFDQQVDYYSYFQKWQTNDTLKIQVISDFVPHLNFYTCQDQLLLNVPLNLIAIQVVGIKVYEAEVSFLNFPANNTYYGTISYIDQNLVTQYWDTCPLEVRTKHAGTLLYEYWNTYNDKGIVFDTGIKFCMRIEGLVREYTPESADQLFTDQKYDTTTENSIPYRTFKNYIGTAAGLPDWIIDKMNLIFSVNTKTIDGTAYNRKDGAKWEITRPTQTKKQDGYMSLDIVPQNNIPLQQFSVGDTPVGDLIVIKKAYPLLNIGKSQVVPGIFNDMSNLIRLAITNKGANSFLAKLGTTAGGNEIAQKLISTDITTSWDIGHFFDAVVTVYLTVPNGVNLNVIFDYNQYDSPVLNPNLPTFKYPKGAIGQYFALTVPQLNIDWNLATGNGNPGTPYANCAIFGTNGLPNIKGKYLQVWDRTNLASLQQIVGNLNNQVEITTDVLPASGVNLFNLNDNNDANDLPGATDSVATGRDNGNQDLNYRMNKGLAPANVGISSDLGLGEPLNITPDSLTVLHFVAIS